MNANNLKYYIEHMSTNPIPEERIKEDTQLKNYLIFETNIGLTPKKEEQIIGKAIRYKNYIETEFGLNLIKDIRVESGKPLNEYKDFLNIWSELTKPTIIQNNITYRITNISMYSKEPDCGILINSQIISKHFHIPYFYHQGSYSDSDVYFTVELFYNSIKIFECDFEFELFNDTIMTKYELMDKKTFKWTPKYTNDKYIIHELNKVECNSCFILNKELFIEFDIKK
jgi:hypothetical protein